MLEWKKFGLAYNARQIRNERINIKLHRDSINTKSVLNKHFKKKLYGLEKGGELTDVSQSSAIETVIIMIYYGSYVAELRLI